MVIDSVEIQKILPHRFPFLLVDRVISFEKNKRAVGIKNVTINEPFFVGHFPMNPVMPGVLMVEALAQVAGVLVLKSAEKYGVNDIFFASIKDVRFRKVVVPGDQLVMEVELLKQKRNIYLFRGKITVDNVIAVEAEFMATTQM
ncbi:MAG: 3-hydroxyacyl-ACP dehydratase FabZ [Proteobacteria bacterium]|nr:3-hydroxyacyl-ACP dehydratase FabZ [Pseudomonadota bacterium]